LKLKFGAIVLVALVVVIGILLVVLRSGLNDKLETLYGNSGTKGLFVAELLADELQPIVENGTDPPDVQQIIEQIVDEYYKSVSGIYSVRYILIQDGSGFVIADTFKKTPPSWLVDKNPPAGKKHCEPWKTKDEKIYFDCAVPLKLPDEAIGAVRAGILQQNPQSPILQKLKTEHVNEVFRPLFYLSLPLVIVITVLLIVAFWYFVIRRIRFLSEATERMSFGDLETIVPMKSPDEIGNLEDTLERMRANLKDAIERLKRRK
jgi:HAMP domain-containing protein